MQKLFEFKCSDCSLVYEDWATTGQAASGISCPSCAGLGNRHYGSMSFNFKGGRPSPSGTDRVVGEAAEKGWKAFRDKQEIKSKIREESQERFVVKTGVNEYKSASDSDKEFNRTVLNTYDKIAKTEAR